MYAIIIILLLVMYIFLCLKTEKTIEMRKSPIHGRGIFANVNFHPGDIVEAAPLLYYNRKHVSSEFSLLDYDLNCGDGRHAIMLGYASIYNHMNDSNANWAIDFDNDILIIKAVKNIQAGDEIFVDYGNKYWEDRPHMTNLTS